MGNDDRRLTRERAEENLRTCGYSEEWIKARLDARDADRAEDLGMSAELLMQGAHRIAEKFVQATGEQLLSVALRGLLGPAPDERKHAAYVYQALMAATDAGYKCGTVMHASSTDGLYPEAWIMLPGGYVRLRLPMYGKIADTMLDERSECAARDYIDNI